MDRGNIDPKKVSENCKSVFDHDKE